MHKKIKGFFKQFQQSTNFDDIRKRMNLGGDVMLLDDATNSEMSSDNKVSSIELTREVH